MVCLTGIARQEWRRLGGRMKGLDILVLALCDPENQPHQWMGDFDALLQELTDTFNAEASVIDEGEEQEKCTN